MKRVTTVLCGIILGVFALGSTAHAAEVKLAYINMAKAFSDYSKTKDYDKTLTDKENVYTAERDKKIAELNSLKDKYNLLSDKEKDAKKGELEGKAKVIKDYMTQKEGELRKEQEDRMKEILKDIETTVKGYAEKEGITFVLNDRVLVYQNKSMDITDKIIDLLNKKVTNK